MLDHQLRYIITPLSRRDNGLNMAPIKKKIDRQEQVKQNMRRMLAKIKNDPAKYEEYKRKERERYKKRKAEGKIPKISDLSERQQRVKRKIWRASSKKYRDSLRTIQDFLVADSPPPSPSSIEPDYFILTPNRQLKKKATDLDSPSKKVDLLFKDQLNNPHEVKNKVLLSESINAVKRDTVTKEKRKKQKRLLCDSLINIHKKFTSAFPEYIKLSYSEFCKNRPFWVLIPNARDRETCACKQCENIALIVRKLRILNIIQVTFPDQLCKELCCNDVLGKACLSRKCKNCKDKKVFFNINQPEEIIKYKLWQTKEIKVNIKEEEKYCQKTVKEVVESTVKQLVIKFVNDLPKYMTHLLNRIHQYKTTDNVKKNFKNSEVLIQMDFSENYSCKYGREIQSAHFGASKPQISLHTVVVYVPTSINGDPPRHINFCTISENLRHDPSAICGHLTPILRELKSQFPQIKTAHFQSNGPTTQYKNKEMFYLIATYIADILDVNQIQWHYSESGHGKGAPDGIGGSVKRKADESVAKGKVLDRQDNEETISFMRRKTDTKFVFPIQEDIATVSSQDIVVLLKNPYEKRGQYFFDLDEIGSIKNLA
nr:unnamed protein product [Callosobruchus analis]